MSAETFASRYVHPDNAHLVGEAIQQAIETNDPTYHYRTEARILRADGEPRTVTVWFRVEKDPQGRTTTPTYQTAHKLRGNLRCRVCL